MLYSALESICKKYPSRTALIHDGQVSSYSSLWTKSDAVASKLREQGIVAGDRVGLCSPNSTEAVIVFWAILKCDAITVCLNEQIPREGMQQILDDAEPALVVVTEALAGKLELESQSVPVQFLDQIFIDLPNDLEFQPSSRVQDDNHIASIIYTSGSTGVPKGVCLTHKNLLSVRDLVADGHKVTFEDSYLMAVPLHYIHGLMILLTMQLAGASIEFMNSFVFPKAVAKKLQTSKISCFSGVPFHFSALIDRGGFMDMSFPDLRWIGVTGGTMATDRISALRKVHPEIDIYLSYGQTECSPRITLLSPDKIDLKPDSVGEIVPVLNVEFLGEDGLPVPEGEIGELVVSGPTVMHGYWNDPENTARVIDEQGRLHTGDLASMDADGDVYIKGRLQAMIKSAGERIFPEELEAILNKHPDVQDAAVLGIPDELYGQRVEAHVLLESVSDERLEDIKKHCLDHIPFARAPRQYHGWLDFPLKANGKTDKQKLLELSTKDSPRTAR